ncbi:MAG: TniB family NTP-binding protein [Phycicoccus sp.]
MKAALLHAQAYTPAPAPPAPLTCSEAIALSEAKRRAYAREVRRYLNSRYVDSERDRRIRDVLHRLIEDNAEALTGTREVAMLTGPNVVGKSTVLYQVAYAVHRHHVGADGIPDRMARRTTTRRFAGRDQEIHPTHAPVLFLSLEAATTVTKFNELVVEALDYDKRVAKKVTTLDLVLEHGVRLLVIDDLHQLILTERLGRYALDHLKAVVTAVGEYGITVIFSGANLGDHDVMNDPQITGRAYELTVAPYGSDTREQALAWQRFLKECSDLITPFLPAADPGMLHNDLPGLILERTQGRMQAVVNLIRRATTAAVEDGTWTITEDHIRAVPASKLTREDLARQTRPSAPAQLHPTVTVAHHGKGGAG